MARMRKLAVLGDSVLIRGESGTGKELIAENLHAFSPRRDKPMRKLNCAALSPGLVESELFGHKAGSFTGANRDKAGLFAVADSGTLFIDEIGDFEPGLQAKFLRVLQEKTMLPVGAVEETTVDVRTLFATHVDLEKAMEDGRFRRDLFFRISTFTLMLPPLRDRLEDIDVLAPFFVDRFLAENGLPAKGLSASALDKLKEYAYPGNIRELAQIVKNAAYFCEGDLLTDADIELKGIAGGEGFWEGLRKTPWDRSKAAFERELLRRRLRDAHGNVAKAAESLGILKTNLYRKLREHGLGWGKDA
jgi:transcriptional regulator with PAS, ATPase and Fis domain